MVPSTLRSGRAPAGSAPVELHVHQHRTIDRGRIDAGHAAGNNAIARVDRSRLSHSNVLSLGLSDLHLRLELILLSDFGEDVPAVTFWPASSGGAVPAAELALPSCCSTPVTPARTCS